ncbi:tetratricopeptide repeat protein [Microcoleus sp. S28C3]|uniref:tetratricopeptide repeat protein n=1 Tax=Microcoleus sp. S28C3 TaxID=3055414 RepID=UPI002FD48675
MNQSLTLFRTLKDRSGKANTFLDRSGEANILLDIGLVYSDLGEKQKALEYYNQSLTLFRAAGDRSGEANTLNSRNQASS